MSGRETSMTFQFRGIVLVPVRQKKKKWKQQLIYREVSQKTAGILEDVIYRSQDGLMSVPSLCAGRRKRRWWGLLTTIWLTSPWTTQGQEEINKGQRTDSTAVIQHHKPTDYHLTLSQNKDCQIKNGLLSKNFFIIILSFKLMNSISCFST